VAMGAELGVKAPGAAMALFGTRVRRPAAVDSGRLTMYTVLSDSCHPAHVASGTVVDLVVRQGRGFYPVFTWVDEAGQVHRQVSNVASPPPRFDKGQPVHVHYTPSNTDDARIDDFLEFWLFALVTGGLGVIFSVVSVLLWIYRRAFFALAGYPELAGADAMTRRDKRRR